MHLVAWVKDTFYGKWEKWKLSEDNLYLGRIKRRGVMSLYYLGLWKFLVYFNIQGFIGYIVLVFFLVNVLQTVLGRLDIFVIQK